MGPAATSDGVDGTLPWLVADVGGTNARFGWVSDVAQGVTHVRQMPVVASATPADAIAAYLDQLPPGLGVRRPRSAALALATAIDGDRVAMTNSPWAFSRRELRAELGLQRLLLLNDFEALALSLPRLRPGQWQAHGDAPRADAAMAVVGPGTGLGVAGVLPTPHGWTAIPGEGGHATLAPADDFEDALLRQVRRRHAHVSAERLLSGIGLPVLHQAVVAVRGGPAAPALEAPQIVDRALDGSDADCGRTVDAFCALLGGFAGNVALTLGARGGVFVGGGIVPRLGQRFFASRFRARFEAKGRFADYLAAIPTAVITDTLAALAGAALAIEQQSRADT